MAGPRDDPSIRRILIALDAPDAQSEALECACRLAARLQAEIAGLFVEDVNLLRLAELPFSRQISLTSRRDQPLDSVDLERQLKSRARAARRALAAAAGRAGIDWSFEVARGIVAVKLLEAAAEADLVAFGEMRCSLFARGDLTSLHESPTERGRRPRARPARPQGPVVAAFDRSAAARRALGVAQRIAEAEARPLVVAILAGSEETATRLRVRAERALDHAPASYRRLIRAKTVDLVQLVRAEGAGSLVLAARKGVMERDTLQALLDRLDCPVLIVR